MCPHVCPMLMDTGRGTCKGGKYTVGEGFKMDYVLG